MDLIELIENKTLTPYYVLEPRGKFWLKRTLILKTQKVKSTTVQQIMVFLRSWKKMEPW